MRVHVLIYLLLMLTTMLSCSDGSTPDPSETDDMRKITVTTSTRAATGTYSFNPDEEIWLWADKVSGGGEYIKAWHLTPQSTATNFTGTAKYWPGDGSKLDVKALHGNFGGSLTDGSMPWSSITSITHTVETDQSTVANRRKSDLLYASATDCAYPGAIDLTFDHLLAKVTVKIDLDNCDGFSAYDLSTAEVQINDVYTSATIDANGSASTSTTTTPSITMAKYSSKPTETGTIEAGSAIIPIQSLGGRKLLSIVSKVTSNARTFSFTPSATFPLEKGLEYIFTLIVKNGKLSVSDINVTAFTDNSQDISLKEYIEPGFDVKAFIESAESTTIPDFVEPGLGVNGYQGQNTNVTLTDYVQQ